MRTEIKLTKLDEKTSDYVRSGLTISGISLSSTIFQAVQHNHWRLPRSRHPAVLLLRQCLPLAPDLYVDVPDKFLWRNSWNSEPAQFSPSLTWKKLHPQGVSPLGDYIDVFAWLPNSTRSRMLKTMLALVLQASIYAIWRERNARLHTQVSTFTSQII